jgi:hypothetical protein
MWIAKGIVVDLFFVLFEWALEIRCKSPVFYMRWYALKSEKTSPKPVYF